MFGIFNKEKRIKSNSRKIKEYENLLEEKHSERIVKMIKNEMRLLRATNKILLKSEGVNNNDQ